MTINIKELKPGQIIYGQPTGNNARYDRGLQKFRVESVGRKYMKLCAEYSDGSFSTYTDSYCPESGATQKDINSGYGGNSGYKWYLSEDEYQVDVEHKNMLDRCQEFFRWNVNIKSIGQDDLKQIDDILQKYYGTE